MQAAAHLTNTGQTFASLPTNAGLGMRSGHSDQIKNSVFSNALSSPVRRSLQSYHLSSQGSHHSNNRSTETNNQNGDSISSISGDSMDMHADTPDRDFHY